MHLNRRHSSINITNNVLCSSTHPTGQLLYTDCRFIEWTLFFLDKVVLLWMNPELCQITVTFQHLYGAMWDEVVKLWRWPPPCYTSSSISPFRKFGFSSQNMMITITKSVPRCLTKDYTLGWECNSLPACSWWIGQVGLLGMKCDLFRSEWKEKDRQSEIWGMWASMETPSPK